MIYILKERETGLLKVGKARNKQQAIRQRMPAIAKLRRRKLGRRCSLSFVMWIDWPSDAELQIHRYCWQLWEGDEWFRLGPRLEQVIQWAADGIGFDHLIRAVRDRDAELPKAWTWHNRDKILAAHKAQFI